jgi:hypothetical protein
LRLTAAALTACALATAGATVATAHGTNWPYHKIGPRYCYRGEIWVYPPTQMVSSYEVYGTNYFEIVSWRPDLLRYNGREHRWKRVYIGDWHWARTTSTGLLIAGYWYWFARNNEPITWFPVPVTRAGSYRVRHNFKWGRLTGYHRQRGPICRYVAG